MVSPYVNGDAPDPTTAAFAFMQYFATNGAAPTNHHLCPTSPGQYAYIVHAMEFLLIELAAYTQLAIATFTLEVVPFVIEA